ncbi:SpaA isopeptide-forming pilin-related protein [Streptomyces sp. NPDC003077]|uniref:SpaA isopeptide-forming pilin-related protein n=1 Tax=Streptomyces sp. NPDC003077 TaxID=3154443 RepID=UPI0033B2EE5E
MRTRSARRLPAAAITVAAVVGAVLWSPAAWAQPAEPTPSASAAPRDGAETGGITILTKDPGGDTVTGATFTLFDSEGRQAGSGKTDADGQLSFRDLAAGIYRLKEVTSGSRLHDVVQDQDVIVAPGADTLLTIIDPFKPASLLLKAQDSKSGKPLAGSTVNIGTGDKTTVTLTTGPNGTAAATLNINRRAGNRFWVKQIKAPVGYELDEPARAFTAKPGDPVTMIVTHTQTVSTPPTPTATREPSDKPIPEKSATDTPAPNQASPSEPGKSPSASSSSSSSAEAFDALAADEDVPSASNPVSRGVLAHTGADATPWLIGSAALLIAAGGGAVITARRHRRDEASEEN